MGKLKFIFYIVLAFVIYKSYVAFTDFEIGVEDRVAKIEEKAEFERGNGYWTYDVSRKSTRVKRTLVY